jgi:hypothetical protein
MDAPGFDAINKGYKPFWASNSRDFMRNGGIYGSARSAGSDAGAAFLGIALIGIALFSLPWFAPSTPTNQYGLAVFQNTSQPVPAALAGLTSLSSQAATEKLATAAGNVFGLPQFSAAYAGTASVRPSGFFSFISLSSPLSAGVYKYGNDLRLTVNATGIPLVGPVTVTYANLTGGTVLCENFNDSKLNSGDIMGVVFGSHKNVCKPSGALVGLNPAASVDFWMSKLANYGLSLNYQTEYQSVYNGTPCTYLAGSVSPPGSQSGNGAFEMCVSDTYYVPLSFVAQFTLKGYPISLGLNATSVSNIANRAVVDAVPS